MKEGGTSLNKTLREYNLVFKGLKMQRCTINSWCITESVKNRAASVKKKLYGTYLIIIPNERKFYELQVLQIVIHKVNRA